MLGKSIYLEKKQAFNSSGPGSQTGRFVCPEGLALASYCLSQPRNDPPLLSASQEWDKKDKRGDKSGCSLGFCKKSSLPKGKFIHI